MKEEVLLRDVHVKEVDLLVGGDHTPLPVQEEVHIPNPGALLPLLLLLQKPLLDGPHPLIIRCGGYHFEVEAAEGDPHIVLGREFPVALDGEALKVLRKGHRPLLRLSNIVKGLREKYHLQETHFMRLTLSVCLSSGWCLVLRPHPSLPPV